MPYSAWDYKTALRMSRTKESSCLNVAHLKLANSHIIARSKWEMSKKELHSALLKMTTEYRWSSSLSRSFQQEANLPPSWELCLELPGRNAANFKQSQRVSWLTVKHLWQLAKSAPAPVQGLPPIILKDMQWISLGWE